MARTASSIYGTSFRKMLARVLWSIRVGRFEPEEALVNGVLDPSIPETQARQFVSKRELAKLQTAVNPRYWYDATEDKGVFYRICEHAGIPTPKVHALIFRGKQGWSRDGSPVATAAEFGRFLETSAPQSSIVKPSRGVHGKSVWAINKEPEGAFSDSRGNRWSAGIDLARAILADDFFDAFVLQDRVTSHPALRSLTGSEALQSSRVVTYVDRNGKVNFVAASIRLITGKAVIDNIDWGRTGNFALQLVPETGRPLDAMTFAHDGRVMQWVAPENHPKLRDRIADFRVPEWDGVLDLLTRAARTFLPIRTLGWDVAITPQGPMIIEANFRWDPMMHPCMRSAVDLIRADMEASQKG